MNDDERTPLDDVVRAGDFAADNAYLTETGPQSQRVRAAVRAAFECAIDNGMIQITDRAGWPTWLIDPPYVPIERTRKAPK